MWMERKAYLAALGIFAALVLVAGCDGDSTQSGSTMPPSGEAGDQSVDLDDPYGGFNTAAESPAFGDESLMDAALIDDEVDDGLAGLDGEERDIAERLRDGDGNVQRDFYALTVLWGNLDERDADRVEIDPGADPVDWTGALSFEGGVINVVRLIAFEPHEDYILRPRDGRGVLSWQSITHGGFDGLRLGLIVPVDDTGQPDDLMLRFKAGPLGESEIEYSLAELADLSEIHEVPASGEHLSFQCVKTTPAADIRGFLEGRWGFGLTDTPGGDAVDIRGFKGRWISANGTLNGYVRGHYGQNSGGRRVFFGKYIDLQGNFAGFLRGTWRIDSAGGAEGTEDYREAGSFTGHWIDRRGAAFGRVRGHWSRSGVRPGTFSGIWQGFAMNP